MTVQESNELEQTAPAVPTRRALLGLGLGNTLEWYDWQNFGLLSAFIGPQFFPSDDPVASTLSALAVFAVGFAVRPLGGVLLGNVADRVGRRAVMLFSVGIMAVTTLVIAITPTYAQVGAWAGVILLVCRLLQVGGGLEMVLGCDIVVAAEHAQFGLTEPRIGRLPLYGGMVSLPRRIPYHLAMGMLLAGRRLPAHEMHRMGLVNEVVAGIELDTAVEAWVQDILACAPLSLRAIKQTVHRTAHLSAREARAMQVPALVAALTSDDQDEGVRAFREKRVPVWTGR